MKEFDRTQETPKGIYKKNKYPDFQNTSCLVHLQHVVSNMFLF